MTTGSRRFLRFNGVGLAGIAVQLTTVHVLTTMTATPPALATAAAVVMAVVHNFLWHRHWTWRDRRDGSDGAVLTFARFALANGAVSLVGGVTIVSALTSVTPLNGVAANVIAIGACGLVNYVLGDRVVFRAQGAGLKA